MSSPGRPAESVTLEESYRRCCQLARRAAKNFYYAFWTLPREKRRAMCALYAFFRRTDDLGDEPVLEEGVREGGRVEEYKSVRAGDAATEARRGALGAWQESLRRGMGGAFDDPLLPAVVDTVRRYSIPIEYLETSIDGVESDLDRNSFATFDELAEYCYQVASVVGLACVHIWGFRREPAAYEAAHACGVAFQMTNILRDVGEDAERGRIYLPAEDLARYGVTTEKIRSGVVDDPWRALVRFEIERIETYYERARALVAYLEPDGVRIYGAMTDIYHGLLGEIRRRDGDVFSSRVRLSRWRKLRILLSHWWSRPRGAGRTDGAVRTGEPIDRAPLRGGAG